ncbi:MAG: VCBS repeat-containing protein [Planctomycetes bacterium]|nr:VCBS repeat-containing protein [Planctomycetota bacterium]
MNPFAHHLLRSAPSAALLLCVPILTGPSLSAQNALEARISVKRVLNSRGSSDWTLARIGLTFQRASDLFRRQAGIGLDVIEIVDIPDSRRPSSWYDTYATRIPGLESEARSDPSRYRWNVGAINVYLVGSIDGGNTGGTCSFAGRDMIVVAAQDDATIAHEIGHYFNLRHTHANTEGSGGGCPGGAYGDCVADTPDDSKPPSPFDLAQHRAQFLAMARLRNYSQQQIDTVLGNLMSYHRGRSLTQGQASRARTTAMAARAHVLSRASARVLTAEFTGDGQDDVFIHRGATGTNVLLRSSRGTSFTPQLNSIAVTAINDEPDRVLTGDFNGNGIADVMFIWSRSGQNRLVLGTGNGFGSLFLNPIPPDLIDSEPTTILTGDFNGDGSTDLWFYWQGDGTNELALSCHDGTFTVVRQPIAKTAINDVPNRILVGDFNKDGASDIMWHWGASGTNRLAIATGRGRFDLINDPIPVRAVNETPDNALVGDFDGDGKSDVLWHWRSNGTTKLAKSFDGSRFDVLDYPIAPSAIAGDPDEALVGDFDGDKRADVLWYWLGSGKSHISLGRDGLFVPVSTPIPATAINGHPDVVRLADFNADNRSDLLVGWVGAADFRVHLSTGPGTFAEHPFRYGGNGAQSFTLGGQVGGASLQSSLPLIGGKVNISSQGAPSGTMGLLATSSRTADPAVGPAGLYVDLGSILFTAPMTSRGAGVFDLSLQIPTSPALEGFQATLQAAFLSPFASPQLSNGIVLTLGY